MVPSVLGRSHPCTPILPPPIGLRDGTDVGNVVSPEQQTVTLWTFLFALAFTGTLLNGPHSEITGTYLREEADVFCGPARSGADPDGTTQNH